MLKIENYIKSDSLQQAKELYRLDGYTLLGGGTLSRLYDQSFIGGIDIAHLLGNKILEEEHQIIIQAMTSLRSIEESPVLRTWYGSVFKDCVAHLGGVQLRNMISAGGTVAARQGTSEFLSVLLALDASLDLYGIGLIALEQYLQGGYEKDIIVSLHIPCKTARIHLSSVRKNYTDASMLHAVVYRDEKTWRIVVGARPMRAKLCSKASRMLEQGKEPDSKEVIDLAMDELAFATDLRATSEYRESVCPVLLRRAIQEVLS